MEGSDLLHAVFMATIAVVVGRVTVYEAIGQDEVDGGIVPVKRRRAAVSARSSSSRPLLPKAGCRVILPPLTVATLPL